MSPEEAEDFYEEDEDPAKIFALFDAAKKGRTAPPPGERPVNLWVAQIRDKAAEVLRHAARVIQSSRTTIR